MDFGKCSTTTNNKKVVVKENRCSFTVHNPDGRQLTKVHVDGCLITDNQSRCDWLVSIENPIKKVLFVELKGCNLKKAINQLSSTVKKTEKTYTNYEKHCFAITTRVPKHGPSVHLQCRKFFDTTKATLSVKNIHDSVKV